MRTRTACVAVTAMLLALLPAAAALAAAPENDSFADATPVTSVGFTDTVDVADATTEADEELYTCAPFANTVWYSVALDKTTDVLVDSAGSDYDTAVAVWSGDSLSELTLVACNDDYMTLQAVVAFTAEAGERYYVQVGAYGGIWESSTLHLEVAKASKNQKEIYKENMRGNGASAYMDDYDEATNTWTYADLYVGETRVKNHHQTPYSSTYVGFYFSQYSYDEATGTSTETYVHGHLEQGSDVLRMRATRSAALATELVIEGRTCTRGPSEPNGDGYSYTTVCTEIGPEVAEVDVSWAGTGPVMRSRYMDRYTHEGTRSSYRGTYSSREAEVAGGVVSPSFEVSFDDAYGWLSRDVSASMTVVRVTY